MAKLIISAVHSARSVLQTYDYISSYGIPVTWCVINNGNRASIRNTVYTPLDLGRETAYKQDVTIIPFDYLPEQAHGDVVLQMFNVGLELCTNGNDLVYFHFPGTQIPEQVLLARKPQKQLPLFRRSRISTNRITDWHSFVEKYST